MRPLHATGPPDTPIPKAERERPVPPSQAAAGPPPRQTPITETIMASTTQTLPAAMTTIAAMPCGELDGDSQRIQVWMPAAMSVEVSVVGMELPIGVRVSILFNPEGQSGSE